MLEGYIRNGVDAWNFTLDELDRFLDRAETSSSTEPRIPITKGSLLELTEVELPIQVGDMIGPYTQSVQLLGQRTAEMHIAMKTIRRSVPNFSHHFTAAHYISRCAI